MLSSFLIVEVNPLWKERQRVANPQVGDVIRQQLVYAWNSTKILFRIEPTNMKTLQKKLQQPASRSIDLAASFISSLTSLYSFDWLSR